MTDKPLWGIGKTYVADTFNDRPEPEPVRLSRRSNVKRYKGNRKKVVRLPEPIKPLKIQNEKSIDDLFRELMVEHFKDHSTLLRRYNCIVHEMEYGMISRSDAIVEIRQFLTTYGADNSLLDSFERRLSKEDSELATRKQALVNDFSGNVKTNNYSVSYRYISLLHGEELGFNDVSHNGDEEEEEDTAEYPELTVLHDVKYRSMTSSTSETFESPYITLPTLVPRYIPEGVPNRHASHIRTNRKIQAEKIEDVLCLCALLKRNIEHVQFTGFMSWLRHYQNNNIGVDTFLNKVKPIIDNPKLFNVLVEYISKPVVVMPLPWVLAPNVVPRKEWLDTKLLKNLYMSTKVNAPPYQVLTTVDPQKTTTVGRRSDLVILRPKRHCADIHTESTDKHMAVTDLIGYDNALELLREYDGIDDNANKNDVSENNLVSVSSAKLDSAVCDREEGECSEGSVHNVDDDNHIVVHGEMDICTPEDETTALAISQLSHSTGLLQGTMNEPCSRDMPSLETILCSDEEDDSCQSDLFQFDPTLCVQRIVSTENCAILFKKRPQLDMTQDQTVQCDKTVSPVKCPVLVRRSNPSLFTAHDVTIENTADVAVAEKAKSEENGDVVDLSIEHDVRHSDNISAQRDVGKGKNNRRKVGPTMRAIVSTESLNTTSHCSNEVKPVLLKLNKAAVIKVNSCTALKPDDLLRSLPSSRGKRNNETFVGMQDSEETQIASKQFQPVPMTDFGIRNLRSGRRNAASNNPTSSSTAIHSAAPRSLMCEVDEGTVERKSAFYNTVKDAFFGHPQYMTRFKTLYNEITKAITTNTAVTGLKYEFEQLFETESPELLVECYSVWPQLLD